MFNGILKSDDVEVYEVSLSIGNTISLKDDCKSKILIAGAVNQPVYIQLPNTAFVGKEISITTMPYMNGTGKNTTTALTATIQHSNTTLFTLKQGTVSFMYVGQQLNGLTATDKAKSGWIILGGVQGDTAITGYSGSVAIGSGAYCSAASGVAIGQGAVSASNGVVIGINSNNSTNGIAIGYAASSSSSGISIGYSPVTGNANSIALGTYSFADSSRIAFKSNARFSTNGDAQAGKFILMRQTTDATPLVMSASNAAASTANILILPNNGTYGFKGIVVAKDATTLDSAMWEVTALMKRGANASTTALVGTPTVTKVFNDAGAAAWTIALTADTTNGGGAITVTGEAGKTIRFVCNVDSAEVI